jgi:DNA polymerase III subunit epsilon
MRQIVLDTETTGLEPELGHRVIEIGCVELVNRRATGRTFHRYLNPEREVDEGALAVHGISRSDLDGQPRFAEVSAELFEFLAGCELVMHNAEFDVAFLDAELGRIPGETRRVASVCQVLDTLALARELHPGQRNSLDALCKRYGIDNSHRELHGALLDARILADVYLAMSGGQGLLALTEAEALSRPGGETAPSSGALRSGLPLRVLVASEAELVAHERMLAVIATASGGRCLWAPDCAAPATDAAQVEGAVPAAARLAPPRAAAVPLPSA